MEGPTNPGVQDSLLKFGFFAVLIPFFSPLMSPHALLAGCLDRLFICPAWARKGYCDSKRNLMKKHCPASCDFCYGETKERDQKNNVGGVRIEVATVPERRGVIQQ